MHRDNTKVVTIGDRKIGGGNPILIQSKDGGCGGHNGPDSGAGAGRL